MTSEDDTEPDPVADALLDLFDRDPLALDTGHDVGPWND